MIRGFQERFRVFQAVLGGSLRRCMDLSGFQIISIAFRGVAKAFRGISGDSNGPSMGFQGLSEAFQEISVGFRAFLGRFTQ